MKKIITMVLVATICLLPINGVTVNAIIPGEDAYQPEELMICEYNVNTGNVSTKSLDEITANVDPSLLASAAPNGVATTQGYTPPHLKDQVSDYLPDYFLGNWVTIGTPNTERYRRTVFLRVTYPDGAQLTGSGFMIGPCSVATAGHIIYERKHGGYATSIVAYPTYNAGSAPYGSARSTSLVTNTGWTSGSQGNAAYDWGLITLNSNLGDSTGWMSVRYQSANYATNRSVDVLGYPGKDQFGNTISYAQAQLYRSTGTICTSYVRQLLSDDTNVTNGMSGGPVQSYYTSTGYTAIALVGGSGDDAGDANIFVRITEEVYNLYISYSNTRA